MDGVAHPLALHSVLRYVSTSSAHSHQDLEHEIRISGDHLAVCWQHSLLVVWKWKSGALHLV